mmetsp:Transcript_110114/g.351253  ORF Transcript_110114/g.351253 Transcript_110114/m.351253 type:complete len:241 (-) Transcript_110114:414-1136(-)
MAPVPTGTSVPSIFTRLPLLSMSSCWMWGTKRTSAWQYGSTARPSWPRTLQFQTASRPMMSGRFSWGGADLKCMSIWFPPSRNFCTMPKPYCRERASTPTADQQEKRPPTQSQNPKTLELSMPKALVFSSAVEHATTCLAMAASVPNSLTSHALMVRAFSMVSAVVNVLEMTITRVVSALKPASARFTSIGSTLARNLRFLPFAAAAAVGSVFKASKTNSTPRYDPPMPMHTTSVSGLPV